MMRIKRLLLRIYFKEIYFSKIFYTYARKMYIINFYNVKESDREEEFIAVILQLFIVSEHR